MSRLAIAITLWFSSLLPLAAQGPEIESVITDQIEFFREDELARAFDLASPMIRNRFGTAEKFGTMVREGYPMVYRSRSLRFHDLRRTDTGMRQIVEVENMSGEKFMLAYDLIETDGGWKIDGVLLLPKPGMAA